MGLTGSNNIKLREIHVGSGNAGLDVRLLFALSHSWQWVWQTSIADEFASFAVDVCR